MSLELLAPLQIPGGFGGLELAVILMIAVLLFGANKIPKLARSTGQAMGEFRRGREEIEQELEEIQDTASMDGSQRSNPSQQQRRQAPDHQETSADTSNADTSNDGSTSDSSDDQTKDQ